MKKITLKKRIKVFMLTIAIYAVISIAFYYLAGYQLHYRQSGDNIENLPAESGTIELVKDCSVEQSFSTDIKRITQIGVIFGTYNRDNTGEVAIELFDAVSGELIGGQRYPCEKVLNNQELVFVLTSPYENVGQNKYLVKVSADSETGHGISPMMSYNSSVDGWSLYLNGVQTEGTLCFFVSGEEPVWIGAHYWTVFSVGLVFLVFYFLYVDWAISLGRSTMLANIASALQKYKFLIKQLVNRDFKTKYKRSILGVLWSFLNPLLTMVVQYIVFSNIFKFDIPNFPVYLLCGNVVFGYFSEVSSLSLTSIIGNANLINKVYIPKYIYPMTRTISSMINLLISMIPLIVVSVFTGCFPTKAYILLVYPLIFLTLFCFGLSLMLSASMVFFRDTQFLWGILSMIWMYLTPIFYPVSILEEKLAWVVKINPLYPFITFFRSCIMDGVSPDPSVYLKCFLFSAAFLIAGGIVFKKTQDRFILYL